MSSVGADIRVRGSVQGVGFRYFCRQHASQLDLRGWVKNLPDSSVSLHVEGERGSIEAFLDELKVGPGQASVTDVSVTWTMYSGQYHSFEIAR
jgi:acylphosphatase